MDDSKLEQLESAAMGLLLRAAKAGDLGAAKKLATLAREQRRDQRPKGYAEQRQKAEELFAAGATSREVADDPTIHTSFQTVRRWKTAFNKATRLAKPEIVPGTAAEQAAWRLTIGRSEADRAIIADLIRERDACKGDSARARLTTEIARYTRELRPNIEDEDPLESMSDEELVQVTCDSLRTLEPWEVEPIAHACIDILGAPWFRSVLAEPLRLA